MLGPARLPDSTGAPQQIVWGHGGSDQLDYLGLISCGLKAQGALGIDA